MLDFLNTHVFAVLMQQMVYFLPELFVAPSLARDISNPGRLYHRRFLGKRRRNQYGCRDDIVALARIERRGSAEPCVDAKKMFDGVGCRLPA